jgi:hypothetical protein
MMMWLLGSAVIAQDSVMHRRHLYATMQYTQEFVMSGHVHVREWELAGDKMPLRHLGMTSYTALQIRGEIAFSNNSVVKVIYDHYFMRGSAIFDRDIVYNGTIIDGRSGIDVSPTRYYRITGIYTRMFADRMDLKLRYVTGLVFDHIVFYLDGRVSPSSPKDEVYEKFGRQAFAYPLLGLGGQYKLGHRGILSFEASGTYIPKFKSFYTEGGHVYLQYSNFLADAKYTVDVHKVRIGVGGKLRHMKLFQESREDTNELSMLVAGPYIELRYRF